MTELDSTALVVVGAVLCGTVLIAIGIAISVIAIVLRKGSDED